MAQSRWYSLCFATLLSYQLRHRVEHDIDNTLLLFIYTKPIACCCIIYRRLAAHAANSFGPPNRVSLNRSLNSNLQLCPPWRGARATPNCRYISRVISVAKLRAFFSIEYPVNVTNPTRGVCFAEELIYCPYTAYTSWQSFETCSFYTVSQHWRVFLISEWPLKAICRKKTRAQSNQKPIGLTNQPVLK